MVFIDTNIVVRLFNGDIKLLSNNARKYINNNEIYISPIVMLELEYLFEIKKVNYPAKDVFDYLSDKIGLQIDDYSFFDIVEYSLDIKWTRDPFDRIITAHAGKRNAFLISADRKIKNRYKKTIW